MPSSAIVVATLGGGDALFEKAPLEEDGPNNDDDTGDDDDDYTGDDDDADTATHGESEIGGGLP